MVLFFTDHFLLIIQFTKNGVYTSDMSSQRGTYNTRQIQTGPITSALTYRTMGSPYNHTTNDMDPSPLSQANQPINILPGGVTVTQNEADVTAVPTSSRSHHTSQIHDTMVSHSPRSVQGCHIVPSAFSTPQYKPKAFQESTTDLEAENHLNQQKLTSGTGDHHSDENLSISDNFTVNNTQKGIDTAKYQESATNINAAVNSPRNGFEELGPDDLSGDDSTFDGDD